MKRFLVFLFIIALSFGITTTRAKAARIEFDGTMQSIIAGSSSTGDAFHGFFEYDETIVGNISSAFPGINVHVDAILFAGVSFQGTDYHR